MRTGNEGGTKRTGSKWETQVKTVGRVGGSLPAAGGPVLLLKSGTNSPGTPGRMRRAAAPIKYNAKAVLVEGRFSDCQKAA